MNLFKSRSVYSLRGRLLLFLLVPLLIVLLLSVGTDYRNSINPTNEAYDRALASTAVALAAIVKNENGQLIVDLPASAEIVLGTTPYDKVSYAIVSSKKGLLIGDQALERTFTKQSADGNLMFWNDNLNQRQVRIAAYKTILSGDNITVIVAEPILKRDQAVSRIVAAIVWSNLLLIIVSMLTVFFGVRLALVPLVKLGENISRRAPGNFRPISDIGIPLETHPLVNAINHLIHNLNEAHKAQQSFLTIAAHQLKTPIAGLQTQMELAIEKVPARLVPRMEKILVATRYLGHFVHQLLSLARSSPEADLSHEFNIVDLAEICEESASGFLDTALDKHIDLGFETNSAKILGSPWLLRELLANLIDNAICYSPNGSRVTCRCGINRNNQPFIEVEDNGDGIPATLQNKIFDRFFRIDKIGKSGTGLGLSIVKEVAQRHGASVIILKTDTGQGVCFRVIFPTYEVEV